MNVSKKEEKNASLVFLNCDVDLFMPKSQLLPLTQTLQARCGRTGPVIIRKTPFVFFQSLCSVIGQDRVGYSHPVLIHQAVLEVGLLPFSAVCGQRLVLPFQKGEQTGCGQQGPVIGFNILRGLVPSQSF